MRRYRCGTHPEVLVGDQGCPWCRITKLEEQIEEHRSREAMFKGEPATVLIRGSYSKVLLPIIRALKLKLCGSSFNTKDAIRIGGCGDYSTRVIMPKNLADAFLEASAEVEKELAQSMVYAVRSVASRVEQSIVGEIGKAVDRVVGFPHPETAGADAIVSEIMGNIADKQVSWDASRRIAEKASEIITKLLEKERRES